MTAGSESLFPEAPLPEVKPKPKEPEPPPGAGFAQVALRKPLRQEFTYRIPAEFDGKVQPGMRVAVPFGSRREVGVVVEVMAETDVQVKRMRSIAAVLDDEPVLDAGLLELTRWVAGYYACAWGEALGAVLPSSLKREKGVRKVLMISARKPEATEALPELEDKFPKQYRLLRALLELEAPIELRDITRQLNVSEAPARSLERRELVEIEKVASSPDPLLASTRERLRPQALGEQQAVAVEAISARAAAGGYETFLLQGVTGSGKTEVYLRVIEAALEVGRGAIVLVPEIALTPQTVGWFRSRFGEVAVLHSRMTDAQRLDMWQRVRRGEVRVVVGARSAVFAPVKDLGVIVVDEEHEPSFKQGNNPRYSARDIAVVRATHAGAVCLLGSATPSLETWHNARAGRYTLLELTERVGGGTLPAVEIVDMCLEKGTKDGPPLFSRRLQLLLADRLEKKQQSILFLNRRGFAPVLWCPGCHETVQCPQCDVALTFHRRIGRAVCHSCCDEIAPPTACPACTRPGLKYLGLGSERVEQALGELLPEARIARMDSDTMRRREDYEETLEAFGSGEIDVLVGTQMIAKGLDFPNVTLVGIVSADGALHLPDFRAAERTFQLLSQVAGRAGRGDASGEIIVQTRNPKHPSIVRAASHDFEGFAQAEDELRAELGYPPHGRLIRAVFEDEDEERVIQAADACAGFLREHTAPPEVLVLGPAPAAIAQVRGRHRRHLLLKAPSMNEGLRRARSILIRFSEEHPRPRVSIDVDPVSLL